RGAVSVGVPCDRALHPDQRADCRGSGMSRILVVDNYDSFVYTIVGYLHELGARVTVVRNDVTELTDPGTVTGYDGVLISPGPGAPDGAGHSLTVIEACAAARVPMLG